MLLECRVPEIPREVLLADEEAGFLDHRGAGEGQAERDFDFAAVRTPAFASESKRLPAQGYSGSFEALLIGRRISRAQHEHGEALPAGEIAAEETCKRRPGGIRRGSHEAATQPEEFEKGAGELDDVVLGPPVVPIARANLEPEAAIERGERVEVASGDHQVIDTGARRHLRRGGTARRRHG